MKIAILSCTKSKNEGYMKAKDLYMKSNLFSLSYHYAKKNADKVYILSAKHGLLKEDDIIKEYDLTLKNQSELEKKKWSYKVYKEMIKEFDEKDELIFFTGEDYHKYLKRKLPFKMTFPLDGLSLGNRMKWLKERG